VIEVLALEGVGHHGLVLHAGDVGIPGGLQALIVPSICQGVVWRPEWVVHEMLSLRMVVLPPQAPASFRKLAQALDVAQDGFGLALQNGDFGFGHGGVLTVCDTSSPAPPPAGDVGAVAASHPFSEPLAKPASPALSRGSTPLMHDFYSQPSSLVLQQSSSFLGRGDLVLAALASSWPWP